RRGSERARIRVGPRARGTPRRRARSHGQPRRMTPIRLTIVQTHPVQYMTPLFVHLASSCPTIDLTVLYAARPTAEQQGVGFETSFTWDQPLTTGYRCVFARDRADGATFASGAFGGLDVPEIGPALLETKPDVVLVPGWHSKTLVRALMTCKRHGIPVLYRGDSHVGMAPTGWRRALWSLRTRLLLRSYTAHLAVGERSRAYLERHGARPEWIFSSPHFVDNAFFAALAAPHLTAEGRARARDAFGARTDDFVCAYVGKLEARKRVGDLLPALAALGRARLIVAGSGPLESALRAEADRLGVDVTWLGFVNQRDMARVYAAADCLALPSDRESWGLVVNEALATGLPVVVSDAVGCAPDLVRPGETGRRFALGDVAPLAERLDAVRCERPATERVPAGGRRGAAVSRLAAMAAAP